MLTRIVKYILLLLIAINTTTIDKTIKEIIRIFLSGIFKKATLKHPIPPKTFPINANNNRNDHILEDERSNNKISKVVAIQGKKVGDTKWKHYESAAQAASDLKLNSSHITKVCKGKRSKTGGYVFRYATDHDLSGEEGIRRGGDNDVIFLYDSDTSSSGGGGSSSSEGVLV